MLTMRTMLTLKRSLILAAGGVLAFNFVVRGQARQGRAATLRSSATTFRIVEATIPEMQAAMSAKQLTSRELVGQYLMRIGLYEHRLHAAIVVNPHALEEAEQLDRERAQGRVRGPLHGIPIALKDNIHTTQMPTTGGALAFAGYTPPYAATLTSNLQDAGAIVIAKTGLTELANWVAGNPTPMPGNYNAVGGFAFNPYDPRPDPREATFDGRPALSTGGSSSGIGTAANLWAASVGTDTGGSVISPSNANKYGMKRDFNLWLKSLGPTAPVQTLTELREWNLAHAKAGAIRYGQSRLDISDEMDLDKDRARNDADHKKDWLLSRVNGIDAVLKANRLDAILTPGGAGAGLAARAGYPIIVVPFGRVPNTPTPAFPNGFDAKPAPFGAGFTGTACSEPRLIELAYAFEQATKRRVPPATTP